MLQKVPAPHGRGFVRTAPLHRTISKLGSCGTTQPTPAAAGKIRASGRQMS